MLESFNPTPEDIALAEEVVDVLETLGRSSPKERTNRISGLLMLKPLWQEESEEQRKGYIKAVADTIRENVDPARGAYMAEQYETLLSRLLGVTREEPTINQ